MSHSEGGRLASRFNPSRGIRGAATSPCGVARLLISFRFNPSRGIRGAATTGTPGWEHPCDEGFNPSRGIRGAATRSSIPTGARRRSVSIPHEGFEVLRPRRSARRATAPGIWFQSLTRDSRCCDVLDAAGLLELRAGVSIPHEGFEVLRQQFGGSGRIVLDHRRSLSDGCVGKARAGHVDGR